MDKEDLLQRLKELKVVEKGSFRLSSGEYTKCYVDIKKICGYPEILTSISRNLWEQMEPYSPTTVASSGYGGIPLATALSTTHNLKLTLVREKKKDYGTKNQIEGYFPKKEDKIAIVDDVFTTGKSVEHIAKILKQETEAEVIGFFVVVKRGEGKGKIMLHYLFDIEELI